MKTIPPNLQSHLNSGATTMCYCWRITRKDGTILGFTDHDEDLVFDNTTFEAEAGFSMSQVQQALGLSVDNLEVIGAFNSDYIDEIDLIAGMYDDAAVELFWVNWGNVSERIVLMVGNLGEVTQNGVEFTAELRSLTHKLNQKIGRKYQRTCDAVFGDNRCTFNATSVTFTGEVSSVISPSMFKADGLSQTDDYFSRGVLIWLTGNNSGQRVDVRTHTNDGISVGFDTWTPSVLGIRVGDTFSVTAGCKQTADVCRIKFNNLINFQGFPHMPGDDIITKYAKQGGGGNNGDALIF